jgi:hypothetical protein
MIAMKALIAAVSVMRFALFLVLVGALSGCGAALPGRVVTDTMVRDTEDASYAEEAIRGAPGVDANVTSYNVMSGTRLKRTFVIARLDQRPPNDDDVSLRGRVYRLVKETFRARVVVYVALSPDEGVRLERWAVGLRAREPSPPSPDIRR